MTRAPWPTATTRFVGVIGWPVDHSLSPSMHNAAFRALDLDWAYLAFPIHPDHVHTAVRGLFRAGCAGLNVTIPHKHAVIECCSSVTPAVEAIGAANTLIPDGNGGMTGDNTDAEGFLRALDEAGPIELQGANVLLIGAGGAAKAVAFALTGRGARLRVANRTEETAATLGDVVPFTREAMEDAARSAVLVVNATSLGMGTDEVPDELPVEGIGPGTVAFDLVYRATPTPWLCTVGAQGARTVDGLGMLLHQGAAAFQQWTGSEAPLEAMRAGLTSPEVG
ncbi:MAG: shikimate dehydrogenase [Thermoleophilia bacterium]|nr:shikimate dehydrogenase [Thermoleophilia bacterium]